MLCAMRWRAAAWAATWLGLVAISVVGSVPPAAATITVVGVDQGSGEVGAVGSTCAPSDLAATAVLVPGVGAATLLGPRDEEAAGTLLRKLDAGDAAAVLRKAGGLATDATHRFAVAVLPPSTAVGGGGTAPPLARAGMGATVASQGEWLREPAAVRHAIRAFERARGSLAERLLDALDAGNRGGGDRRCGPQRASSAFLIVTGPLGSVVIPARGLDGVAKKQRQILDSLGGQIAADEIAARLLEAAALPRPVGPGKPPVYLSLLQPRGGFDAVDLLRQAYDAAQSPASAAPTTTPASSPSATGRTPGPGRERTGLDGFAAVAAVAATGAIVIVVTRRSRRRSSDPDGG